MRQSTQGIRLMFTSRRHDNSVGAFTMHLAFAYDHRYFEQGGTYYAGRAFGYETWQRYLCAFDRMTVIGRRSNSSKTHLMPGVKASSGPGVDFLMLPDYSAGLSCLTIWQSSFARITKVVQTVDAVVARLPSVYGFLAVKAAIKAQKPWAVELVSDPLRSLWYHGKMRAKLAAPVAAFLTRQVMRDAKWALYVTNEYLQRCYPTRAGSVRVACTNADLTGRVPTTAGISDAAVALRMEARHEHDGPLIIGTIGSLNTRYKGLDTLMKALGSVARHMPRFEVHVVGPGDAEPWRKLAARHGFANLFVFRGVISDERALAEFLRAVDVYVQPSRTEGMPRALMEAMASGCAAVASNVGGIPELLPPECLHAPCDWRRLGQLLLKAAVNRDWRRHQGSANQEIAAQYAAPILDRRRTAFWCSFANSIYS